ncbi:TPA: maltodextrin glucosidase [Vibrio parahaemolyticus]|uniref:maltodextrin glucosidase n=1 Tax=Vibrio parahaemolyticus TaxID=670 RepID=UPI0032998DA5|nr:maltodextrin glucosidase [Vibrio parahaemolyticus]HCE2344089.1 maltodextrin glucosidase [Vibrio parahaemolyticus]HCE4652312.1 maltodextrin glucosidase [Vibrio parahaemolyticus]HCE4653917.1 maltodextrin glucosidase [Vibrio parahaemolyticus]HCG8289249.1 maltodextrin glucosidase [Vibrio parahaemolyticus]
MSLPFLFHSQTIDGLAFDGKRVKVCLKTEALTFDAVYVRIEPDNEEYLVAMVQCGRAGELLLWEVSFEPNRDRDITHYVFKVVRNGQQYWLDARGVQKRIPPKEFHFKLNVNHQPPKWVQEQVFYQIFPDRFAASQIESAIREAYCEYDPDAVIKMWGEPVGNHQNSGAREFFGGDLKGVEQKLGYLEQLGVTALYFNPIFSSPSNHKYDTTDYFTIDPMFGTNEHFASLCEKIRSKNMKIVLDAVFNHTSVHHPWFDIQQKGKGAYGNPKSDFRDYYFFDGESNHYIGWKGIDNLPVLNFENHEVREYIYQGEASVIKHWLKPPYSVDGWRFDVIHMLGEGEGAKNNAHYVKAFRQATKSVNPNAYVLGEHFFEATQWLQGEQEDGAMNYYGFAHPVRAFIAHQDITYDPIDIDGFEFKAWLDEARAKVPFANQLSQLNQLDSHDTARFLTLVNGDEKKMQIALALLMTYVGAPCIYYGSEVGLEGSFDPDNRRCFPWHLVQGSHWIHLYQQWIEIRKQFKALQSGSMQWLYCDERAFAYARQLGEETIIVAVNIGLQESTIDLPLWQLGLNAKHLHQLLDKCEIIDYEGHVSVNMAALSINLWQVK